MQPLFQTIFLPRLLGFASACLVLMFHQWSAIYSEPWKLALCFCCLIYPLAAYVTQRIWLHQNRVTRLSMLVDAILVGLLIAAVNFNVLIIVVFISFLTVCTGIISGLRGVVAVISIVIAMTFTASLWLEMIVRLEAWLELCMGLLLVVFLNYIAWLVFRETHSLVTEKRRAHSLEVSLRRKSDYLSRYISPQLLADVQLNSCSERTRRRRLTLCFTDLSGFTELMDRLPEHEMTNVLNEYLNAMATIAIDYGGTIDKFMGDGLMIFFGDPKSNGAHQDAIACVSMAFAMRNKLAALSATWKARGLFGHLKMRVGIHTGYCAVGNFGSEARMDYTAVGGAVNIASRLESQSPIGGILVSGATAELIDDVFALGVLSKLPLKGIRDPVACALVVAEKGANELPAIIRPIPGMQIELAPHLKASEVRKALSDSAEQLLG